jgi:hypothetical protein
MTIEEYVKSKNGAWVPLSKEAQFARADRAKGRCVFFFLEQDARPPFPPIDVSLRGVSGKWVNGEWVVDEEPSGA